MDTGTSGEFPNPSPADDVAFLCSLGASGVSVGGACSMVGTSGAAIMTSLAAAGGGAVLGVGLMGAGPALAASLGMNRLLKDDKRESDAERLARSAGRCASVAGAGVGAVGAVVTLGAAGVTGFSAAGITSGLAAVGSVVGGGMAAGVIITTIAPAALAAALGYGVYRLLRGRRPGGEGSACAEA